MCPMYDRKAKTEIIIMLTEQEKNAWKQKLNSNRHEVFVISIEEMDAIIRSSPRGSKPNVQKSWQEIKQKVALGANYYSAADDAVILAKLVGDLGSFGAKAYIKTYGGKSHIILKGHSGLRNILTGTKYGIKNPKIVTMGLGKAGAVNAAKTGGVLTVILLSAYRVVDYVLTDEATLTQLVGTLATDFVKIGIATGASIAAATFVAGVTTIAIGPIVAVIIVGVVGAYILDSIDKHYGITDRVIAGLDEIGEDTQTYFAQKKQALSEAASEAVESVIDYAIESAQKIVVRWIRDRLNDYLSPRLLAR